MERLILHVDVNNAFLSWSATEMLNNGFKKDIRNTYSVIAGEEKERRGIVLAKSDKCKKLGIKTADSLFVARKKCRCLEVYPPNYAVYKKYSDMLYNFFCQHFDLVERYSIDECFIDYSGFVNLYGDVVKFAYRLKNYIKNTMGFTVNVGIGNNKLCAKMASDFLKPDKVHTLFDYEIKEKLWNLDIEDLFMVGKRTSVKLKELGINKIYDLANKDVNYLIKIFKKQGQMMWEYANGIDNSEVESQRDKPKSISNSVVLPYDYNNKEKLLSKLRELSNDVAMRLRHQKMYCGLVGVNIKYADFTVISKQQKVSTNINSDIDIYAVASSLFIKLWNGNDVRSIGVRLGEITDNLIIQLSIFESVLKQDNLQSTIDNIKDKFGDNIIKYGDDKL
ncbi:MAG: DNA polymerase IV [bacterium]|nr:DNA polymerase IV [bacterium]